MKNFELKAIAINKLLAHPDNPNVMSAAKFNKLVRNIERTGLYEPLAVRPHPQQTGCFQIINGHHRVKALEKLGCKEADCVVWDVDDQEAAILLATLNRLAGSDVLGKKINLLKILKEQFGSPDLARRLPHTRKQIELLTELKQQLPAIKPVAEQFAVPLVFFVTPEQHTLIEEALFEIPVAGGLTKTRRRAAALAGIADKFLRNKL